MERILLSPPDVGDDERAALLRAFDGGWIAPVGPEVDAFEDELAGFLGASSVAALASGTAALHLALLGVGVRPGDEVIVQTATFAATAFAVVHAGATPVFCDVDRRTWGLDPLRLEHLLGERAEAGRPPAAVISVDLYGLCCDYRALRKVCDAHDVPLIEDAAEALGSSELGGAMAGTLGDFGVLSFNGNKILTTSGGGALVGSTEDMARARFLATQARQPVLHYEHTEIGYNYRLSNLLAALGRAQLEALPDRIERRREVRQRYVEAFPELEFLSSETTEGSNCWLSVALMPDRYRPSDVCVELDGVGIEARPAWKPMHLQPVFASAERAGGEVAEAMFNHGLCLPSGSALSEGQQERVIDELRNVFARHRAPTSRHTANAYER